LRVGAAGGATASIDHRLRLTFEDGTIGDVDFAGRD
jgi:hypothetical protein